MLHGLSILGITRVTFGKLWGVLLQYKSKERGFLSPLLVHLQPVRLTCSAIYLAAGTMYSK